MFDDIDRIKNVAVSEHFCEACIKGKQARLPFHKIKDKSHVNRALFIVHSDVSGPISPPTILNNQNYFVLFVDQYTHYCVTYLLQQKSGVFPAFKDFVAKSEAHFNSKFVTLYSDNGGEYFSTEMKQFCIDKGITYHPTIPRTPQLNGVAERMVRSITERARAMLHGAKLDLAFWGEAVLTATYLINLTPTKALSACMTPYEAWHGKKPKIEFLRVFGSTVYVHNKTRKRKFDEKSWKAILVGYEPNGYKVWDVENEKFVKVRDVIVDETNYLVSRPVLNLNNILENRDKYGETYGDRNSANHKLDNGQVSVSQQRAGVNEKSNTCEKTCEPFKPENSNKDKMDDKDVNVNLPTANCDSKPHELRRSERIKGLPHVSYDETDDLTRYILSAQSLECDIPSSIKEIEKSPDKLKWKKAIQEEIDSLLINKTWNIVPEPIGRNIVACKWVFAIKNNEFGEKVKYKARLVACGYSQKFAEDYDQTFAPVARIASLRILTAFANQFDLLIHQMDVKTAFLNGVLKEEIYMRIPEGMESKENHVCKLNKALYGLKQGARCWFETFEIKLLKVDFKTSPADRCIYFLDRGDISKNIYVILYVDDVVIICKDLKTMMSFKRYLMSEFSMVDLGSIRLFLGIKFERGNEEITMSQCAYIDAVLKKFNMSDCNPISNPLPSKLNFEALNSDERCDAPCQSLIGCLMYIMLSTRPDLSTAVNILSRFASKNNKELWQCLKRVLRYLKGSRALKLTYKRNNDHEHILSGFVDSDWAGDSTDRKSTTGFFFKLFGVCTVSWNTKKQKSVAASSTEAEYMALFEGVREALWLKSLLHSVNLAIQRPIPIYEDNNGCISIANNPSSHKRSKHIDIKYHFSREQVEENTIILHHLSTGDQPADLLTKPLPTPTFLKFRAEFGLQSASTE